MFWLADARYLYVTYLLFDLSKKTLQPCSIDKNGKIKLPRNIRFPRPYWSASATSNYDVGLIVRKSGRVTAKFNDYFNKNFQKPFQEVFGTNINGFSLQYDLPELFKGLTFVYNKILPQVDFFLQ